MGFLVCMGQICMIRGRYESILQLVLLVFTAGSFVHIQILLSGRFCHGCCEPSPCGHSTMPSRVAHLQEQVIRLVRTPNRHFLRLLCQKKWGSFPQVIGLFPKSENHAITLAKHLSTWLRVDAHQMVEVAVLLLL